MPDITVTTELLDEIEELARYAGGEAWGISETDGLMIVADDKEIASTAIGDLSGGGADWDDLEDKAKFIARMDPPTTIALLDAHRAALARIRELEAKAAADLADYETSLETMTAVHDAKIRELEAENVKQEAAIKALQDKNSRMAEQWTEDMRNAARDAVIRERERRDFSDSIIKSEIDRLVRARSLEEAAAFVEKHQIADAPSGQVLDPRMDGNRAGIAYADGIRSLISEDNKK